MLRTFSRNQFGLLEYLRGVNDYSESAQQQILVLYVLTAADTILKALWVVKANLKHFFQSDTPGSIDHRDFTHRQKKVKYTTAE